MYILIPLVNIICICHKWHILLENIIYLPTYFFNDNSSKVITSVNLTMPSLLLRTELLLNAFYQDNILVPCLLIRNTTVISNYFIWAFCLGYASSCKISSYQFRRRSQTEKKHRYTLMPSPVIVNRLIKVSMKANKISIRESAESLSFDIQDGAIKSEVQFLYYII